MGEMGELSLKEVGADCWGGGGGGGRDTLLG